MSNVDVKLWGKVFQILMLAVFLIGCGDDDPDPVVLFTYNTDNPVVVSDDPDVVSDDLLILTDSDGDLIDTVSVVDKTVALLEGNTSDNRLNVTRVRVTTSPTFKTLNLTTYVDVASNAINRTTSDRPGFQGTISVNVDQSISNFILANPANFDLFDTPQTTPIQINLAANSLLVIWNSDGNRRYAFYENIEPGSTVDVVPDDFALMSFAPISTDLQISGSLILAQENDFTDPVFPVDIGLNFVFSTFPLGFYVAEDLFSYYQTTLNTFDSDFTYRNTYYGNLPTTMDLIEISDVTTTEDLTNFSSTASGNFTLQQVRWASVPVTSDDPFLSWVIFGPADTNFNGTEIISLLEEAYPDFEFDDLEYQSSDFSVYIGVSTYDQIIAALFDDNNDIRSSITEVRTANSRAF